MVARTSTFGRRGGEREPPVRWCPTCRDLQCEGPVCRRCPDESSQTMTLVRGLASIDITEEYGLVRYRGERRVTIAGLILIALVPLAAAAALGSNVTWLATALLSASFLGLPALAFLDAQRAGARNKRGSQLDEPPALVPALPERAGSSSETALTVWSPTVYRGEATAISALLESPISATRCVCYRLDIRVGEEGELVARHTSDSEFAITCADGTQVLITGLIDLNAAHYDTLQPTERTSFTLNGSNLLPLFFTRGGWAGEIAVPVGAQIQVQGALSDELRTPPRGSSYRQAGAIRVLRGSPGQPVVVELL